MGPSGPTPQVGHAMQGMDASHFLKVRAGCIIISEKALSPTRPERAESESMEQGHLLYGTFLVKERELESTEAPQPVSSAHAPCHCADPLQVGSTSLRLD